MTSSTLPTKRKSDYEACPRSYLRGGLVNRFTTNRRGINKDNICSYVKGIAHEQLLDILRKTDKEDIEYGFSLCHNDRKDIVKGVAKSVHLAEKGCTNQEGGIVEVHTHPGINNNPQFSAKDLQSLIVVHDYNGMAGSCVVQNGSDGKGRMRCISYDSLEKLWFTKNLDESVVRKYLEVEDAIRFRNTSTPLYELYKQYYSLWRLIEPYTCLTEL